MKRILASLFLSALAAQGFAQSPITTMQYREMTRKHERMLSGTQEVPALSVASVSYSDTCWDDLTVSALSLFDPPGAAGVAIVPGAAGIYVADFSPNESGAGIAQLKHAYKRGTAIKPHLHVTSTNAATATNVWTLTMNSAVIGGAFTNAYSASVTSIVSTLSHAMPVFPDFTNYLSESSIVGFVVSNSGPAAAQLLDVDFHFEIEKPGSDDANPFE